MINVYPKAGDEAQSPSPHNNFRVSFGMEYNKVQKARTTYKDILTTRSLVRTPSSLGESPATSNRINDSNLHNETFQTENQSFYESNIAQTFEDSPEKLYEQPGLRRPKTRTDF